MHVRECVCVFITDMRVGTQMGVGSVRRGELCEGVARKKQSRELTKMEKGKTTLATCRSPVD